MIKQIQYPLSIAALQGAFGAYIKHGATSIKAQSLPIRSKNLDMHNTLFVPFHRYGIARHHKPVYRLRMQNVDSAGIARQ